MNKLIQFKDQFDKLITISVDVIGSIEIIDEETTGINHSQGAYFSTKMSYEKVMEVINKANNIGNERIIEYKIVTESNVDKLTLQINALISDGYQPYGSPFGSFSENQFQVMVKRG